MRSKIMSIIEITFEQAIKQCLDNTKSLLLGNGFSIAASKKFHYSYLLNMSTLDDYQKSIFKQFSTCDFEVIISKLEDSAKVIAYYDDTLEKILYHAAKNLREEFRNSITRCHEKYEVTVKRYDDVINFINSFGALNSIFTTNYDLLLYWLLMKSKESGNKITTLDDGFHRDSDEEILKWVDPLGFEYLRHIKGNNIKREQKIFYLHGALFLYDTTICGDIIKVEHHSSSILEIITNRLINNMYFLPLIVLEGDSELKLKKIRGNPYLNHCYSSLRELEDILVIIGHSLNETDNHIIEAIKESNVKQIYISYYKHKDVILEKAKYFEPETRSIFVFEILDGQIWGASQCQE